MGAPLTEFVIESVIRDGLGELKADTSKLDDIFEKFTEAHFTNQYGQNKIDELKTYIANNQIRLVQGWAMVPMSVPCISIQLQGSTEDEGLQNLGNEFLDEDVSITPAVLVPSITLVSYNSVTGKLTVDPGTDLSVVCPGLVFVDASDNKFTIGTGNSNMTGDKYINIGPDQSPNLGGTGRIESRIDIERTERRMVRLRESISLGCHANDDIHLTKFIYYILTYILKSRQEALITRGINLDWGQGSVFDREDQFSGENIFSRFITVNCLTDFIWDQGKVNLIDCFDPTIKVPDPDPDSDDTVQVSPEEE